MDELGGYQQLYTLSAQIPDWRSDLGKLHKLTDVIFLIVVATIAGAQNCQDIWEFGQEHEVWLRRLLTLKHGIPHHDMYLRTLAAVPPEQFESLVRSWTAALRVPGALTVEGVQVAFDGQTLRGSLDRASGVSPVHMVSAYLVESGVTLGTKAVDEKSNEIIAISDLIRSLNLQGATVTIDSLGCQRKIATAIREAGAHYQLQVKENQSTLQSNIQESLVEATRKRKPGEAPSKVERYKEVDKGHGRIETRTCILSRDLSGIEKRDDWQDLSGIASVLRERTDAISGKTSREIALYIISDPKATVRDIERLARRHWGIENGLHWSMDVVWGSDAHTIRDRNGAQNMARIRRFCATMVKQSTGRGMSQRRIRLICVWNPANLLRVLSGEVLSREPKKVMPVKMRKAREAATKVAKKK